MPFTTANASKSLYNVFVLMLNCVCWHSGDIQIGMVEKKGALEVEVIRARGLVGKPGSKALPGEMDSSRRLEFKMLKEDSDDDGELTFSFLPLHSTLRQGLPSGKWSLHSQKENKSSKKNLGSSLPAATAV